MDDSFASVAVAELVFLLFLLLDCALDATAIGVHHRSYGGVHPDTPLGFSATVGAPRRCAPRPLPPARPCASLPSLPLPPSDLILRFTVLVIMLGDWVARVFVGYRTGDGGAFTLPYTAVLRPVVLALRSGPTRRAFHIFVGTLLSARDTLLLIFAFVAVSAVVCMVLLRNVVTGDGDRARGFATYHDSWLTLFTYLFTCACDPHPGCQGLGVRPTLSSSLASAQRTTLRPSWFRRRTRRRAAHASTSCSSPSSPSSVRERPGRPCPLATRTPPPTPCPAGTFIIVSLIIAIFQSRYMERREKAELSSNQLRRRGLVVAYAYLDPDQDGVLQPHEFRPFFEVCATNVPSSIFNDRSARAPWWEPHVSRCTHTPLSLPTLTTDINVREFVLLCEAMKADVDNAKAVTSEEELDRLTSQQEVRWPASHSPA